MKNQIINMGSFYFLIFGENPYGDDALETMTGSQWFIHVMFTVIVNIVALNLLISIISNTYDNVQSSLDAHHTRTKIEILLEISLFMAFFNYDNRELSYIHFIRNANE